MDTSWWIISGFTFFAVVAVWDKIKLSRKEEWLVVVRKNELVFFSNRKAIRFLDVDAIQKISLTTVDLLTQDEILLSLTADDENWQIAESMDNFRLIINLLEERLLGFCYTEVEAIANKNAFRLSNYLVWERNQES